MSQTVRKTRQWNQDMFVSHSDSRDFLMNTVGSKLKIKIPITEFNQVDTVIAKCHSLPSQ